MIATLEKLDNGKMEFSYFGLKPKDMEIGTKYTITKYVKKRTLDQNALLWKAIGLLAKEQNKDDWQMYLDIMENCKVCPEYLLALPEAETSLKQAYRVVKALDETREVNGKQLTIFKCQIGSSKLDTKKFKEVLDYTLNMCSESGIVLEME